MFRQGNHGIHTGKIQFFRVLTQIDECQAVRGTVLRQTIPYGVQVGSTAPEKHHRLTVPNKYGTGIAGSSCQQDPQNSLLHISSQAHRHQQAERRRGKVPEQAVPRPERKSHDRQRTPDQQGIFPGQVQPGHWKIGAPAYQGIHPGQPEGKQQAEHPVQRHQPGKGGGQQYQQPQNQSRAQHPDGEQVGRNSRPACRKSVCQQHRQSGQRCQGGRFHRFRQAQQAGDQPLPKIAARCIRLKKRFLPAAKCRRQLHPQHPAKGQLKTDVTGRVGIGQTNQHRCQPQGCEQIRRLQQSVPRQGDEEESPRPQHRHRQPGKNHVEQNQDRLHRQVRAEEAEAAVPGGKHPAEKRKMQPGNSQQMRDPRRAEILLNGLGQAAGISQQNGSFDAAQVIGQPQAQRPGQGLPQTVQSKNRGRVRVPGLITAQVFRFQINALGVPALAVTSGGDLLQRKGSLEAVPRLHIGEGAAADFDAAGPTVDFDDMQGTAQAAVLIRGFRICGNHHQRRHSLPGQPGAGPDHQGLKPAKPDGTRQNPQQHR